MKQDQIETLPEIKAERFTLRPVRKSDAGLLSMYAGDIRVARATRALPHPLPPGAIEAYIARAQSPKRTEDIWIMDGSDAGLAEVLGVIWLTPMDRRQSEITFWVAPALWNTGIASEAVGALIAANPRNDAHYFGEVFQDNPVSARVLTNAGFDYLGDAEAFSVARDGTVATWTYSRKMDV